MSYTRLLIDNCAIERYAVTGTDEAGWPLQTWTALHASIPCRLVFGKGTEVKVGQEVWIVHEELYVEDIDVTTQDRVLLNGALWNILDVAHYSDGIGSHHKKLFVQKVV